MSEIKGKMIDFIVIDDPVVTPGEWMSMTDVQMEEGSRRVLEQLKVIGTAVGEITSTIIAK